MERQNLKLIDNQEMSRFEMQFDYSLAHISYEKTKNSINLIRTNLCAEIEHPNTRDQIILAVLEYIKIQELMLIPSCPYVALYIMKHEEWGKHVIR